MRHKYTQSLRNINRQPIDSSESIPKRKQSSLSIQLPFIRNKKAINLLKSALQKYSQKSVKKQLLNIDVEDPNKKQKATKIMQSIRQKARLLKQLKQKILEFNDNTFTKKVLTQISYSSLGKIVLEIWNYVQRFQHCNQNVLNRLQIKFGRIPVGQDFIKSMNFMNNICRFFLADYKKKMWLSKQKQINGHFTKLNNQMFEVGKKIQDIGSPQTKIEVIRSLSEIKQECFAKKQRYLDWKQRAIQRLKQNQVHCQILRAQIFTQQFF